MSQRIHMYSSIILYLSVYKMLKQQRIKAMQVIGEKPR